METQQEEQRGLSQDDGGGPQSKGKFIKSDMSTNPFWRERERGHKRYGSFLIFAKIYGPFELPRILTSFLVNN